MLAKNSQKVIFKCIIKKRLQKFIILNKGVRNSPQGVPLKLVVKILYEHKHVQTADFTT